MWKSIATWWGRGILENFTVRAAGVAQSAEHRFCKPRVESSSLSASSAQAVAGKAFELVPAATSEAHWNGWIPKRPKGPDCKSGGNAFAGSNPAPPMSIPMGMELDSGISPRPRAHQSGHRDTTTENDNEDSMDPVGLFTKAIKT